MLSIPLLAVMPFFGLDVSIASGIVAVGVTLMIIAAVWRYGKLLGIKTILDTANAEISILKSSNQRLNDEAKIRDERLIEIEKETKLLKRYVSFEVVPPAFQAAIENAAENSRKSYELALEKLSKEMSNAITDSALQTQKLLSELVNITKKNGGSNGSH